MKFLIGNRWSYNDRLNLSIDVIIFDVKKRNFLMEKKKERTYFMIKTERERLKFPYAFLKFGHFTVSHQFYHFGFI